MVVVVVEGDAVAVKAVDVYEGVYKVCVLDCLGRKIFQILPFPWLRMQSESKFDADGFFLYVPVSICVIQRVHSSKGSARAMVEHCCLQNAGIQQMGHYCCDAWHK